MEPMLKQKYFGMFQMTVGLLAWGTRTGTDEYYINKDPILQHLERSKEEK